MAENFIFYLANLIHSHLRFTDLAMVLMGLYVFRCIIERVSNKAIMLWPMLGIMPALYLNRKDMYDWVTRVLIKSGGTFRYRGVLFGGSYGVVTSNPSNVEYMLKTNFANYPKGRFYKERFYDLLGCGIFNVDDEEWKEQRRMAKTEMHSSWFMENSMKTIQGLVHKKLLKLTEKMANAKKSFDLQEVLLRFTFDNICITAFGVDPGSLAIDLPEIPFAKAFEEATECSLFRFMLPYFVWKPMKFFGVGYEKRLHRAVVIVREFAEKTVSERRKTLNTLTGKSDLLSRLMQNENSKTGNLSDKLLQDFCVSFIIAGRDTTSVAMVWFFWLLHKNPEVEKKILLEINSILSRRKTKISEEKEVIFTAEELKEMIFLHAALSESLRLYPSVPIEMKHVLTEDILPDGTVLKPGSRVHFITYSMGRMESIWGKDCNEFKPERWINNGNFVRENQFKYAVFNGGPRLCAGKNFAYLQMKMVVASILLRYSIEVDDGQCIAPKVTTTLYMKNGMMVKLKARE